MTEGEDNSKSDVERRNEKRVAYTAVLAFKELKGQKIPRNPPKPNATARNLSLSGISFQSRKRPQSEHLILYLPDGTRAVARVADVRQDDVSLQYISHCTIVRWVPDGVTTLETPNPKPVLWPANQDYD